MHSGEAGDGVDDGVDFLPLDFSVHPDDHPHVDIILHKLSDDIMFRWGTKETSHSVSYVCVSDTWYVLRHPTLMFTSRPMLR